MRFLTAALPLALALCAKATKITTPTPPGLTYLYTAYVDCANNIDIGAGPNGVRSAIPIIGGNFTGPRINGTILDLGADWGITGTDGVFHADTRYSLRTSDGANIYIRTAGPTQTNGDLYLRMIFETGAKNYFWLNNIVGVGVLTFSANHTDYFTLRIDGFYLTPPS